MIHHAVYFTPIDPIDEPELAAVMDGLAGLIGEIDGFTAFHHGTNIDLEGKSPEASYGFTCIFADKAAAIAYANDPRHQALGGRLVALCGGADRIKVFDIDDGEICCLELPLLLQSPASFRVRLSRKLHSRVIGRLALTRLSSRGRKTPRPSQMALCVLRCGTSLNPRLRPFTC